MILLVAVPAWWSLIYRTPPTNLPFLKTTGLALDSIDKLSKQELNCTLCFLNVLIDEFVNEKSACPNRVITRLVLIRIYVQNSMELMELKELQSEQEKSDGGK